MSLRSTQQISLLVPDMPSAQELAPWLARIDAARWYTNFGPLVQELEQRLARHYGAERHCVSVASGTMGVELALSALGLGDGAPVLVPGLTFVATAAAVRRAGYRVVFADVEPGSWLLTPEIAQRAARETGARAVVPVSTYGCPQDADAWDAFVQSTGIAVVMDAAAAFDRQAVGRRFAAVFSLHATKILGAGEGGFVVSADAALLERVRRLSNFGIDTATGWVELHGCNGKLSEYHAAVALAALERWPQRRRLRVERHRRMLEACARRCPALEVQRRPADGAYSIFPVLLPSGSGARPVQEGLAAQGIESRRWYCPTLDRHPAFRDVQRSGEMANCALATERLLALPFHPFLGDVEIARIFDRLAELIGAPGAAGTR